MLKNVFNFIYYILSYNLTKNMEYKSYTQVINVYFSPKSSPNSSYGPGVQAELVASVYGNC